MMRAIGQFSPHCYDECGRLVVNPKTNKGPLYFKADEITPEWMWAELVSRYLVVTTFDRKLM